MMFFTLVHRFLTFSELWRSTACKNHYTQLSYKYKERSYSCGLIYRRRRDLKSFADIFKIRFIIALLTGGYDLNNT